MSQLAEDGEAAVREAMSVAQKIADQAPVAVRTLVRSLRRKQETSGMNVEAEAGHGPELLFAGRGLLTHSKLFCVLVGTTSSTSNPSSGLDS